MPAIAEYVLEKLRGYNFVNDGEYAKAYVTAKSSKKGERLIRMELRAKGIADADAADALAEIDEETQISSAKAVLEKYMRGKTADAPTLQKAYRHLLSKGYSFDVAKSALSSFGDVDEM